MIIKFNVFEGIRNKMTPKSNSELNKYFDWKLPILILLTKYINNPNAISFIIKQNYDKKDKLLNDFKKSPIKTVLFYNIMNIALNTNHLEFYKMIEKTLKKDLKLKTFTALRAIDKLSDDELDILFSDIIDIINKK